jgi:hypothetical protein
MPDETFHQAFARAAADPWFLGHALLAACGTPEIACARLGVDLATLKALALCRAPEPATWDADLDAVCGSLGVGRRKLEAALGGRKGAK